MRERSGGQIVADTLQANRIEAAFCVPGESFLAVLDALYESRTRLITCRHEAGAANIAVAYGKLTAAWRVPGHQGPGSDPGQRRAPHHRPGLGPHLLLVGQVSRALRGREAFQELDVPAVFGPMAKWAAEADDPARLPSCWPGRCRWRPRAGRDRWCWPCPRTC